MALGNGPIGAVINPANSSKIFYGMPGEGPAVDSNDVATTRMNNAIEQQKIDQAGQQAQLNRQFQSGQAQADRDLQNSQFQQGFGLKQGILGQISPLLSGLQGGGGSTPAAPSIARGGVWSDQQINEQVNAGKASNAANADQAIRGQQSDVAAQGFGSRSPLLAALGASTRMGQAANDSTMERQTRYNAAQGNADMTTKRDQLATDQWNLGNVNDTNRLQAQNNYRSSLASVLASLA